MRKLRIIILAVLLAIICLVMAACDGAGKDGSQVTDGQQTDNQGTAGQETDGQATDPGDFEDPDYPFGYMTIFFIGGEPVFYYEFNFHFVSEVNSFASSETAVEAGFDPNLPLSDQIFPGTEYTMETVFMDGVASGLQRIFAFYLEAMDNDYVIGESDRENIDGFMDTMTEYAAREGISEEEFFKSRYGIEMTREQVYSIVERDVISSSYEQYLSDQLSFSDEEIEAYYNENKDQITIPDVNAATLRLIGFVSKQMALDVKEKYEQGDMTEESFIELVTLYSTSEEDIANGGLNAGLGPRNKSIEEFDEMESWIFDSERQPGDHTLLETPYGYEFAYYVSMDEPLWKMWSRSALRSAWLNVIVDSYPITNPGSE